MGRFVNADQAQFEVFSALKHFCLGFVEVFVCIDNQTADGLAAANKSLHLGEEGVLKLYVSVSFMAIFKH